MDDGVHMPVEWSGYVPIGQAYPVLVGRYIGLRGTMGAGDAAGVDSEEDRGLPLQRSEITMDVRWPRHDGHLQDTLSRHLGACAERQRCNQQDSLCPAFLSLAQTRCLLGLA
jgi:hypothetical protein